MAIPYQPYSPYTGKFSPLAPIPSPYAALSKPVSPYTALMTPGSSQPGTIEPNLLGLLTAMKERMPGMNARGRIPAPAPQPEMPRGGLLNRMLSKAMNSMPSPYASTDQSGSDYASPGLIRRLLNLITARPQNPQLADTIAPNASSAAAAFGPYGVGF